MLKDGRNNRAELRYSGASSSLASDRFNEGWIVEELTGDGLHQSRRSLRRAIVYDFAKGSVDLCLVRSSIGFRRTCFEKFNNVGIKFNVNSDLNIPQIRCTGSCIVALLWWDSRRAAGVVQEFFFNTSLLVAPMLFA